MAERPKTRQAKERVEKESNEVETEQLETENLSTKLTNIAVLTSSLQTVSNTCHTIKESNSYVGYGMTVAESSLDKAFKAGKAVLDSRTLAPITNTAIENIRYLDKEVGVMVDKFLKANDKQSYEGQANGSVQEILRESRSHAVDDESLIFFLGRKFFQVTSFLVFLPYNAPKYALSTIFGFFTSGSNVIGRKRKERGSVSEEVKLLEPQPVKRKYGERLSTSSEEETLEEILRDYKSEDDPDYVPDENEETSDETEGTSEESEDEQLEAKQAETNASQSSPTKTSTPDPKTSEAMTAETREKTENKTTDSKATKLEEIPLKEVHHKTEASKDVKESKTGTIDASAKTRRSSKSPLLQKLLSPGRRSSRKSQKNKTEAEKELAETAAVSEEGSPSKPEDDTTTKLQPDTSSESSKPTKVEENVHDTTKSKAKPDETQKKADKVESSTKSEVKTGDSHQLEKEPLSAITGPFKFGSKKSK